MGDIKNMLAKIVGQQTENVVFANGVVTKVTVETHYDDRHRPMDSTAVGYLEKKYKKVVPALESIRMHVNEDDEQSLIVTMSINGKHNTVEDIRTLKKMACTIISIAEDRLTEPDILKNIGDDCKPWIDDEPAQDSQKSAN